MEKKEKASVSLNFYDDGKLAGVTVVFFGDEKSKKWIKEMKEGGSEVIEVEEGFEGEVENMRNIVNFLHKQQEDREKGRRKFGDSSILSDAIPGLVIEALRKAGRLKE